MPEKSNSKSFPLKEKIKEKKRKQLWDSLLEVYEKEADKKNVSDCEEIPVEELCEWSQSTKVSGSLRAYPQIVKNNPELTNLSFAGNPKFYKKEVIKPGKSDFENVFGKYKKEKIINHCATPKSLNHQYQVTKESNGLKLNNLYKKNKLDLTNHQLADITPNKPNRKKSKSKSVSDYKEKSPKLIVLHPSPKKMPKHKSSKIEHHIKEENSIKEYKVIHNKAPFKYGKEIVQNMNYGSKQQLSDNLVRKGDNELNKCLSINLNTNNIKKTRKLQHHLRKVGYSERKANDILRKIKRLPIKFDDSQLFFMDTALIDKMLEYCNEPTKNRSESKLRNKKKERRIKKYNISKNHKGKLVNETSSKFNLNETQLEIINNSSIKIDSNQECKDISYNDPLLYCNTQQHSRNMILTKKKNQYSITNNELGKKTRMPCTSKNKYLPSKCHKINYISGEDNEYPTHVRYNSKLPTIFSESFDVRATEKESTIITLSNAIILKDGSSNKKLAHINDNVGTIQNISSFVLKSVKSKNRSRTSRACKLPHGIRKKIKNDNVLKFLKKNLCNTCDKSSEIYASNKITHQKDHLMVFYTNRESSSTSKDSVSIAIRRDADISNCRNSNNVLNVVIKQTKNSLPNSKDILGEDNYIEKCTNKVVDKTNLNSKNSFTKISFKDSSLTIKGTEENICLKEVGCQTDNNKIIGFPLISVNHSNQVRYVPKHCCLAQDEEKLKLSNTNGKNYKIQIFNSLKNMMVFNEENHENNAECGNTTKEFGNVDIISSSQNNNVKTDISEFKRKSIFIVPNNISQGEKENITNVVHLNTGQNKSENIHSGFNYNMVNVPNCENNPSSRYYFPDVKSLELKLKGLGLRKKESFVRVVDSPQNCVSCSSGSNITNNIYESMSYHLDKDIKAMNKQQIKNMSIIDDVVHNKITGQKNIKHPLKNTHFTDVMDDNIKRLKDTFHQSENNVLISKQNEKNKHLYEKWYIDTFKCSGVSKPFAVSEIGVQTDTFKDSLSTYNKDQNILTVSNKGVNNKLCPVDLQEGISKECTNSIAIGECNETKLQNNQKTIEKKGSFVRIIEKVSTDKNTKQVVYNGTTLINQGYDNHTLHKLENNKNESTFTNILQKDYQENGNRDQQTVYKINAIYEFLLYLEKLLKDNAFIKINDSIDNGNILQFNKTLHCLCSNCVEIINKLKNVTISQRSVIPMVVDSHYTFKKDSVKNNEKNKQTFNFSGNYLYLAAKEQDHKNFFTIVPSNETLRDMTDFKLKAFNECSNGLQKYNSPIKANCHILPEHKVGSISYIKNDSDIKSNNTYLSIDKGNKDFGEKAMNYDCSLKGTSKQNYKHYDEFNTNSYYNGAGKWKENHNSNLVTFNDLDNKSFFKTSNIGDEKAVRKSLFQGIKFNSGDSKMISPNKINNSELSNNPFFKTIKTHHQLSNNTLSRGISPESNSLTKQCFIKNIFNATSKPKLTSMSCNNSLHLCPRRKTSRSYAKHISSKLKSNTYNFCKSNSECSITKLHSKNNIVNQLLYSKSTLLLSAPSLLEFNNISNNKYKDLKRVRTSLSEASKTVDLKTKNNRHSNAIEMKDSHLRAVNPSSEIQINGHKTINRTNKRTCSFNEREFNSESSLDSYFRCCNDSLVFINQQLPVLSHRNLNIIKNTQAKESGKCSASNKDQYDHCYSTPINEWISLSECNLPHLNKKVSAKHDAQNNNNENNNLGLQMNIKMNEIMHVKLFCQSPESITYLSKDAKI